MHENSTKHYSTIYTWFYTWDYVGVKFKFWIQENT